MKKELIYSILLFVLIYFMPLGSYFLGVDLGFINVYSFRVVLAIAFIILLIKRDLLFSAGPLSRDLTLIMFFWIGYGFLSMTWSISLKESMKDVYYLCTGLIIHLTITSLLKRLKNGFNTFGYGWLVGFLVVNLIAAYEVRTGYHLSQPFIEKLNTLAMNHPVNFVPVSTFDNPNNYATYLILSLPILTFLLRDRFKWSAIIWPMVYYFIYTTGSRLGMIAFFLSLAGWIGLSYYNKHIRSYLFSAKRMGLGLGLIGLVTVSLVFTNTFERSETIGKLGKELPTPPADPNSSGNVRKGLLINGVDFTLRSWGMGIGAGNFRAYIREGEGKANTGTVLNPHNWFIEIISQYGILVFSLCAIWFSKVFWVFWRNRHYHMENFYIIEFGFLTLAGYFIVSNSASSFIGMPLNWVILSLLAYLADDMLNQPIEKVKID